ncbi:uncharacterized protein LOC113202212 [Frankliniella occidentalis]|uniref:Uncharacterized protein LOC113202212 n=1 Tax=Frankliniella occidentalis TaxID=133901 RepID=A0A6J1RT74_FRAOC|nr:uncharacterized protein LOC113202212 [Frankliniella occidentalis]
MAGEKASKRRSSAVHRDMAYDEKLRVLDEELVSFHQYCQQAGFTPEEMAVICAPLVDSVRAAKLRSAAKTGACMLVAVGLIALLASSTTASPSLHFTALGRLVMIKVLPFWDWTSIFYESCLVANPFFGAPSFAEEDCVACESLKHVDRLSDVSYEHLLDNYLSRDAPAIVVDAMEAWPVMTTDHFYFDNVTQIYLEDDKLIDTVPCILTSNLRTGSSDLHAFLKRIRNPSVEKWFVHWQNCDIHAVKALRRMYQRPYFLSNSVSPAHFNWVLMSSNYNTSVYKKVDPDSGLIMLAQIRGSTSFRLTPHKACNTSCSELTGSLHEGEMLVFTNFIWSFEYYPGRSLDNVAILTETVWDEKIV